MIKDTENEKLERVLDIDDIYMLAKHLRKNGITKITIHDWEFGSKFQSVINDNFDYGAIIKIEDTDSDYKKSCNFCGVVFILA